MDNKTSNKNSDRPKPITLGLYSITCNRLLVLKYKDEDNGWCRVAMGQLEVRNLSDTLRFTLFDKSCEIFL